MLERADTRSRFVIDGHRDSVWNDIHLKAPVNRLGKPGAVQEPRTPADAGKAARTRRSSSGDQELRDSEPLCILMNRPIPMTPGTGPAADLDVPFTVDADLELDGAMQPWLRRGADVRIRRGAVPAGLRHVEQETPVWQRAGGRVLVRYPWGMRFLVEGGARIAYEAGAAAELDLRLFLLSTPWLALALQRGLLPLQASAVMDGAAVHAFAGPPGAGKSTLAAALSVRGYMFFTDDTLLLDPARIDGGMRCYGYKDLKLWPHGAALTRLPPGGRVRTSKSYRKHYAEPPRRSLLRLEGAADEGRLRRAAAFSSFARLREREDREGFRGHKWNHRHPFFRSGESGGWRRHLTPAQARRVVVPMPGRWRRSATT